MTDLIKDMDNKIVAEFVKNFAAQTVVAKQETFALPMAEFPLEALGKFLAYGAQRVFNDAVGGSDKTADDKCALVKTMIAEFKEGNIGKRRTSVSVDNVTKVARQFARKALRAVFVAKDKDWKGFTERERAEQDLILDKVLEGNPQFIEDAKKEIVSRAKAAEGIDLGDLDI